MSLTLSLHLSLQTDVYVFLFTDLLLITKAKKGDKFKVIKPVSESYLQWMSLETWRQNLGGWVSVYMQLFWWGKMCSASWPFPTVGLVDHGIVAVVVI